MGRPGASRPGADGFQSVSRGRKCQGSCSLVPRGPIREEPSGPGKSDTSSPRSSLMLTAPFSLAEFTEYFCPFVGGIFR